MEQLILFLFYSQMSKESLILENLILSMSIMSLESYYVYNIKIFVSGNMKYMFLFEYGHTYITLK